MRPLPSFLFVLALLRLLLGGAAPARAAPIDYPHDVRPILAKHCYACHGPQKQKSGLRLDVKSKALAGGELYGASIVPGNAKASPILQFLKDEKADLRMPPEGERLSDAEVAILSKWVAEGAVWPEKFAGENNQQLWSLAPLAKPAVPAGAANPLDAFVAAKRAEKRLAPSPAADRRTLYRRLSYDLTGLPPSEEELAKFVADPDPKAYEALVDRLLASPRYGEHWARHWLDVANYADTHGNDHDYARPNAWRYRDYVIRALNDDKPYARFVQEQVAGDALFPEDPQATVALGFLAAGPWDHTLMVTVRADTVDHRMAQNLDRDNMVSTVMGTFQSLTVHCARCHNHKFDPISQREYYALQAVFAGVDRADRPVERDAETYRERRRLLAEHQALAKPDAARTAALDQPQLQRQVALWEEARGKQDAWEPFEITGVVSTGGATLTRQPDGSWFASGTRPDKDNYLVTARRKAGKLTAVRLEVLPDDRLPQKGPGRWDNGNFHLSEFRLFAAAKGSEEGARPVPFARATADYDEGPAISAAQALDGKNETQWGVHPRYGEPHEAVFELKDPADYPEATTFTMLLEHQAGAPGHGIGRFRLSATGTAAAGLSLRPLPSDAQAVLKIPAEQRTAEQRQALALAVLRDVNRRALAALPPPQMVYAVTRDFTPDGPNFTPTPRPRPIHLLVRGDINRPGEPVGAGTVSCVPGMSADLQVADSADEAARRAALAKWLVDERNVLTWRSIVNRVWAWHFGRGLCDTPSDLGRMGGAVSHPELLDWLAIWFRDEAKGSLKELHRLILTSETWRQTSVARHGMAVDADNRWLWRQNRPRLTGEQVRDSVLAASGKLDLTMGGPPAVQFISKGDATFNAGGNPAFLDYEHFDQDSPAARRRAIYRFLFRTVPDPFLDALDCPDGGASTPVRNVSTTAQQAFAMLNNAFLIRQSEHLAARIAARAPSPEAQVEAAFRAVLLRPPRAEERAKFSLYTERHGLANACQLLFNSNEFLYVD